MQARLTTKPVRQVISAIQALDLESIKLQVMDSERGEGWTREYAESIELAYKNYLTLLVKYQDDMQDIVLSKDVDEFWHTHILQTMKYADDCQRIFGNFLHHNPHIGKRTSADVERKAALTEKTRRLYQREFGNAQKAGAAYCNATMGGKAAYCNADVRADKVAYCNATVGGKAAYCNATMGGKAAYCNADVRADKVAYCNATVGGKAAYCNATVRADKAAYCNAAVRADKAAYCNATVGGEAAYCNADVRADRAAYCNATVRADKAAYCNAAVIASRGATHRSISAKPGNSARHRLAAAT